MVEFEERFHGKEGAEVETRENVSGVKKRYPGVDKKGNRWRARVRNPLLRTNVHLGHYGTPEEAALVVNKKKAEFEEMFKGQKSSRVGTWKKLPWDWGVRKRNRRNRVHISHPKLKSWVSDGSHRACEDAAIVANKEREEFRDMYKKKAEFDASIALDDNSTYDVPGRLGDGLVHGSPKNISTAFVCDKTFDSEFDKAVSLGIINEYGQLLGKYRELDTQTWLSSTGKCYGFY